MSDFAFSPDLVPFSSSPKGSASTFTLESATLMCEDGAFPVWCVCVCVCVCVVVFVSVFYFKIIITIITAVSVAESGKVAVVDSFKFCAST